MRPRSHGGFFNPVRILAAFFLLSAALVAESESSVAGQGPEVSGPSLKEAALDHLLSERDSQKSMDTAIDEARKCGVSEQAILEARFLYHVDRREDDAIAAMLPEFVKRNGLFKIEDSAIFSVSEDWLAVTEYVKAIASLKKGDREAFKTHIMEAFWLSPRQAAAFAPHIERLRLEESMLRVRIDFDTSLTPLGGGDAVSLKNLISERKAMVIHFWSPASSECEASLPDFAITAKALGEKGIAMVSLVPGESSGILADARKMIAPLGMESSGSWLIDGKGSPLARELRIQTLPTLVLLSNEGRVLFNGDPADNGLWDALTRIDPQIIRPGMPGAPK
jgi:hypothetical protein